MNNIIKRKWNQNSMVIVEDLQGMAFQAESGGHTFQISGIDGEGNAVSLSGTPAGVMLRADGQDVALTCSVSGGVVSATLPANAYSVPGRFGLTIFLTSDGQKTAIYAAVGTVGKTSSGTVAPPAGSDVVTLVNQINTAIAAIPANYNACFAPAYSTSGLYSVGQYVTYNGNLYRCNTAITTAETWTAAHWTQTNLGADVYDLKSAINLVEPSVLYRQLILNYGCYTAETGTYYDNAKTLRTTYIQSKVGDIVKVPSGYQFAILFYKVNTEGTALEYQGWSNEWLSGEYCFDYEGMIAIAIRKYPNIYDTFTENECYALNNQIKYYSVKQQRVNGIAFFPGVLNGADVQAMYAKIGDDGYGISITGSTLYLNFTMFSSEKFKVKKGTSVKIASGYQYVVFKYNGDTMTSRTGWITGDYGFDEDAEIKVCIDTSGSSHTPYTSWPNLDTIFSIVEKDTSVDDVVEKSRVYLYIPEFRQGSYSSTADVYRVTTKETVAFPIFGKNKLKVSMNPKYVLGLRIGQYYNSLYTDLYWYTDGDIIELPDVEKNQYYIMALANAAGDVAKHAETITPTEDFDLKIFYVDEQYTNDHGEDCKILASQTLQYIRSGGQYTNLHHYPVIAHASDTHGDYQREKNFLDFCDQHNVDCACVTGDIVLVNPSHGIGHFHSLVKNHHSLTAFCVGNHDALDNNMDDDDVYDYFFAPVATEIGNATGKTWYYKDLTEKNIRIISINLYQYGGQSRGYTHFKSDQIGWLIDTLAATPQDYGVLLLYHSPQRATAGVLDQNYPAFFQSPRFYDGTSSEVEGSPINDIIDAFIAKSTLSKTYTQTGDPDTISVSADFTNLNSGVEFIAHLCGHQHADTIGYVPETSQKQLLLGITITACVYGWPSNDSLNDLSDLGRRSSDCTQDAFNVYVIDRENKNVRVVRIGQSLTYQMNERSYMVIPYADTNS